jgi:hypothetical protein
VAPYHGLWIEMKRRKGGQVSADQHGWMDALRAEGYAVAVARGADEAIEIIIAYLGGTYAQ